MLTFRVNPNLGVTIQKVGAVNAVILATLAATLIAWVMYSVLYKTLLSDSDFSQGIVLTTLIPAITVPLLIWPLVTLLINAQTREEKMRHLATTDSLTGLLSRNTLICRSAKLLQRSIILQQPFAVIMIDLDYFKRINDKYGHSTGDAALRTFGKLARDITRNEDLAGRLGGEEFLIVLPNTSHQSAITFSRRLHTKIRSSSILANGHKVTFSASMGISAFTPEESKHINLDILISEADQALYSAKNKGRNQTIIYPQSKPANHLPKTTIASA